MKIDEYKISDNKKLFFGVIIAIFLVSYIFIMVAGMLSHVGGI